MQVEPRCRVCRTDHVRTKVNDLLASGASYAMILRALEDDNTTLDPRDRVTIDSIRNHSARHFPVQDVARATYRDILERRARENAVDFVNGVATAITLLDARAGQPDIVDARVKVGRIIDAVRSMLPESSWPELVRRIDGDDGLADPQHHQTGGSHATNQEFEPPATRRHG